MIKTLKCTADQWTFIVTLILVWIALKGVNLNGLSVLINYHIVILHFVITVSFGQKKSKPTHVKFKIVWGSDIVNFLLSFSCMSDSVFYSALAAQSSMPLIQCFVFEEQNQYIFLVNANALVLALVFGFRMFLGDTVSIIHVSPFNRWLFY